jgi:ribosomal-protein-alanine N-acetyltransferase
MKLELHTERVLLTPLAMTDLDIALELWTDPEVVEYICEVPTESEIRHEMPDAIKRGGNGGIGIWCIVDRKTREKLGSTYLLPLPIDEEDTDFSLVVMGRMPDAEIEIGYFLKRAAWGRGYATEVCERLLQFAFQEVSLKEVVASIDEDNVASRKVLEKSGLLDRGRTRCYGKDSPIYRITRDEWNKLQQSL